MPTTPQGTATIVWGPDAPGFTGSYTVTLKGGNLPAPVVMTALASPLKINLPYNDVPAPLYFATIQAVAADGITPVGFPKNTPAFRATLSVPPINSATVVLT